MKKIVNVQKKNKIWSIVEMIEERRLKGVKQ